MARIKLDTLIEDKIVELGTILKSSIVCTSKVNNLNLFRKPKKTYLGLFPDRYIFYSEKGTLTFTSDVILKTPFSNVVQYGGLHFISKAVAQLLEQSSNATIREWGKKCREFYDGDHKYVDQISGLLRTPSPAYQNPRAYNGQAFWRIDGNSWYPVTYPTLQATYYGQDGMIWSVFNTTMSNFGYYSIQPISFDLISPQHVAAMIGDVSLMQELAKKGMRLDEYLNKAGVTPLELAVSCEQLESINFLLQEKATRNLDKAFKLAVEKCSFAVIEKLLLFKAPITDDVLAAANNRHKTLGVYLEMIRKSELAKLAEQSPLNALRSLLDYPAIPVSLIAELICAYPELINLIEDEASGNTILHQLIVTSKDAVKLKAYMSAIFVAGDAVEFNIEKTNKANQTALRLALNNGNKDIIATVMLYGIPMYTSLETELHNANINISAINQELITLLKKTVQKNAHLSMTNNAVLAETIYQLAILEAKYEQMKTLLQASQQNFAYCCSVLKMVSSHLNLPLPEPQPVLPIAMEAEPSYEKLMQLAANSREVFAENNVASLDVTGKNFK